jgi:hypothetical protein
MKLITENTTLGDLKILLGQLGVTSLRLEISEGRRLAAIFHPSYGHHVHTGHTEAEALDGAVDKLTRAIGAAHAETLP